MGKLIAAILALGCIAGLVLGFYWLLWSLWCWVVPQMWTNGPDNFIRPGFWLFAGAWLLISLAGKAIFGRSDK